MNSPKKKHEHTITFQHNEIIRFRELKIVDHKVTILTNYNRLFQSIISPIVTSLTNYKGLSLLSLIVNSDTNHKGL